MHYLKRYGIIFLIIPTLFLAGLYSSVTYGATDMPHIITPSKIICCKNDTSAGSESTSTSLASPLKNVNADEKKIITPSKIICCKNDTSAGSESTSTSLASPLKRVSTTPTQSDEDVETEKTESTSTSLASPLKKVSTTPTQSDEDVETEKTESTSTSLASPLKNVNADEKKIITPSKIICCKNDTSAGSESTSTSLASPLKRVSTTPTQSDEDVETEKTESTSTSLASPLKRVSTTPTQSDEDVETILSNHELSEENKKDRNLSDQIQANLGRLLHVNSDEVLTR